MEEAVGLLRGQPWSTWAIYLLGAIPCVLAWLFFWADMSRGAHAGDRLVGGALGVALAYLWMKLSQLAFVRRLKAFLLGHALEPWSWRDWLRAGSVQAVVQPWRLLVLPLASLLLLPLPWCLAFFENLSVLGADRENSRSGLVRKAWRQARLWPGQNQALSVLLALVGLVVWINLVLLMVQVPQLMKSLIGVETVFTRSAWAYFNTTFLAVSGVLAFLCVDPVIKSLYLLRCHYGQSLKSGEDLRAGFRRLSAVAAEQRSGVGVALTLGLCLMGAPVRASQPEVPVATQEEELGASTAEHFERSIAEVMRRPLYEWRFPRDELSPEERSQSALGRWIEDWLAGVRHSAQEVRQWMGESLQGVGDFLNRLGRRLFGRGWRAPGGGAMIDWTGGLQLLLWLAIVVALAGAAAWAVRAWWRHPATSEPALNPGSAVDWMQEEVAAAEVPQDEWIQMAEGYLVKGERRLALRAFYLAALSGLSRAGWIRLARHKSNRDYAVELDRRFRGESKVPVAFRRVTGRFEPVWYGLHEATPEALTEVREGLEVLR
jgi:hypothetical protein